MPDLYKSETKKEDTQKVLKPEGKSRHSESGHTHNPLAAYSYCPDNVSFETQDSQEKVILFLRKHPITNLPWILLAVLLAFAPAILTSFPLLSFLPVNFQFVALLLWYLVVTAFVLESALTWFFNVYIVTDERIIDVDFLNLIYREITEAKIDKIQDVTHSVGGVVRTIFNYGDVVIQTAGTAQNLEFEAVPEPAEVTKIIQELRIEEEQEVIEGRVR